VQVAPELKPVIVKLAGSASEAEVSSFATTPEVQVTAIVTVAALLSEKSLLTSSWAAPKVFRIVQDPAVIVAAQVPLDTYPFGIGDSVAVQTGLPTKPDTVNTPGDDSDTEVVAGVSVPLAQDRATVTLAALLGTKSLLTVNVVWGRL